MYAHWEALQIIHIQNHQAKSMNRTLEVVSHRFIQKSSLWLYSRRSENKLHSVSRSAIILREDFNYASLCTICFSMKYVTHEASAWRYDLGINHNISWDGIFYQPYCNGGSKHKICLPESTCCVKTDLEDTQRKPLKKCFQKIKKWLLTFNGIFIFIHIFSKYNSKIFLTFPSPPKTFLKYISDLLLLSPQIQIFQASLLEKLAS